MTRMKMREVVASLVSAAIAKDVPEELAEFVKENLGATLYPDTLTQYNEPAGYGVALKAPGVVLDNPDQLTPIAMEAYLARCETYFEDPDNFFGLWIDSEDMKVYLDVVTLVADKDDGIALGRAEDQIAIWDFENQEEIRLR